MSNIVKKAHSTCVDIEDVDQPAHQRRLICILNVNEYEMNSQALFTLIEVVDHNM